MIQKRFQQKIIVNQSTHNCQNCHAFTTTLHYFDLLQYRHNLFQNNANLSIDLFGRGFSDDPSDLPHDARLYSAQILLAVASSPLPWTGTNGFAIIGYSLGGGISASFTSSFPNLISSLILIAPSGLLRESHIAWQSKILYSTEGILPESLIQSLVRQRLDSGSTASTAAREEAGPEDAVAAEIGNVEPGQTDHLASYSERLLVTVASAVQWQLDNHTGFIPAFVSSIRHAPITNQHASWVKIGDRLSTQKENSADQSAMSNGLWRSKVLMILGRTDSVIVREEIEEDAIGCLGRENLETVVIDAGHDLPISKAKEVVSAVLRFWGEDVDAVDAAPEWEEKTGT
jgi:pimeloyl-ACP methyl ester carboxylesterase